MKPGVVAGLWALGAAVVSAGVILLWDGQKPAPILTGDLVVLVGDSIGVGMTKPLQDGVLASGASFLPVPHVGWTARSVRLQLENNQQIGGTIAIVSLGSNDEALLDPSTEAADVAQVVSLLRLRGARRIVWVLGPNYAAAQPPAPATKASQQIFANLVSAQPGVEVIIPSSAIASMIGADGIHLPPAGYTALAQQVLSTLRLWSLDD